MRSAFLFAPLFPALFAALSVASCADGDHPQRPRGSTLAFDNAWVRPLVGEGRVTAAYCEITNEGEEAVLITGFSSDDPDVRVELHETTEEGGIVHMRPLDHVTIPPGGTVSLAPGGRHLMLFGLDGGPEVMLNAVHQDGLTLPVVFTTRVKVVQ